MKKFMTIAMIVLAAAMLVVSCAQAKVDEIDHSITVEAAIGVTDSKAITVPGGDTAITKVVVSIRPMWNDPTGNEAISYGKCLTTTTDAGYQSVTYTIGVNDTTTDEVEKFDYDSETAMKAGINLGYISQGQWNVKVQAYNKADVEVFSNITATRVGNSFYFVKGNQDSKLVTLTEAYNDKKFTISLGDIKTPTLRTTATDSMDAAYDLAIFIDGTLVTKYTGVDTTPTDAVTTATDAVTTATDAITTWSATTTSTDAVTGTHTYKVLLVKDGGISNNGTVTKSAIVGGVSGTFFLSENSSIYGTLNPAEFTESVITVEVDKVTIDIGISGATNTTDKTYVTELTTTATDASVTVTLTATPASDSKIESIAWEVEGGMIDVAQPVETKTTDNTSIEKSVINQVFSAPGRYHVSVIANGSKASDIVTITVYANGQKPSV